MDTFGNISNAEAADVQPVQPLQTASDSQPTLMRPKLQRCMTLPASNWYGGDGSESANAFQPANEGWTPQQPLNDVDWGLSPSSTNQQAPKTFKWYACVELRGIYHTLPAFPGAVRGRIAGFDDIEDARWFMRRHGAPEYWHEDPNENGVYADRGDLFASEACMP